MERANGSPIRLASEEIMSVSKAQAIINVSRTLKFRKWLNEHPGKMEEAKVQEPTFEEIGVVAEIVELLEKEGLTVE